MYRVHSNCRICTSLFGCVCPRLRNQSVGFVLEIKNGSLTGPRLSVSGLRVRACGCPRVRACARVHVLRPKCNPRRSARRVVHRVCGRQPVSPVEQRTSTNVTCR